MTVVRGPELSIPPLTVPDLLRRAATTAPAATAVIERDRRITYRDLDRLANQAAQILRPHVDARRWSRVALSWEASIEGVAAYYGVFRSGAVMVGLMPPKPAGELSRIIAETLPSVLVLDPVTRSKLADIVGDRPILSIPSIVRPAQPSVDTDGPASVAPPLIEPAPTDPALLAFSSGTTGPSKCVRLSHGNIVANAFLVAMGHRIEEHSIVLPNMPILNPLQLNAVVAARGTLVLDPARDAPGIADRVGAYAVTHFYGIPELFNRMAAADLEPAEFATVRYFSCGSKALSQAVSSRLETRFGVKLFQGYGQTETAYHSHVDDPDDPVHGSVGRALANTETRIVDVATRRVLAAGEVGEIELRGPQCMSGYLNRPDLEPFTRDGWFMTGDVGYLDDTEHLFVIDRLVDIGIIDGRVISPSELERQIEAIAGVGEAGVIVTEDNHGRGRVEAFVAPSSELPIAASQTLLGRIMATVELDDVHVVDRLPRLPINGKIDRKVLLTDHAAAAASNPVGTDEHAQGESAR